GAVAGDERDGGVGGGGGQTGRDRRRAPVDRVHAVRVHVVGEAARAADARDEDHVLALVDDVGHHALHCRQDRVVAASRAPPHFLVADELFLRQDASATVLLCHIVHSLFRISVSISDSRNGCPWI